LVRVVANQRSEFTEYEMFKPWTPFVGLLRTRWEDFTKTGQPLEYTPEFDEAYQPKF
jgi:hypothetical protein